MGSTSKFWTRERIAKLRDMAADGMTKREAADYFGLPYQNIHYQTRVNRIEFRGSELTRRKDPSNPFFRARWASGYTVEEAAEKIGISDDTLRGWERGDSLPRDAFTRDCAAEVYGVDPQSLCTDEELEARDRKSRIKAAETWNKRKGEGWHGYRDVEGAVRGERSETEGGPTSVELVQEASPGGRAEEAADDRRVCVGAECRLCGGVDRGGGQMRPEVPKVETEHYIGFTINNKDYVARKKSGQDVEREAHNTDEVDDFLDIICELVLLKHMLGELNSDQGQGQR